MASWNGDTLLVKLQAEMAKRLLRAAVFGVEQHKLRVNKSASPERRRRQRTVQRNGHTFKKGSQYTVYTDPSRPGEYPRVRTGVGRDGTTFAPTSAAEVIAADFKVKIGVSTNAKHMLILELYRQRKGLIDTFQDLQPQLQTILTVKGA